MSKIETVAKTFRRELLDRNTDALNRMADAYGKTWVKIKPQLQALAVKIEEAKRNPETAGFVSPSWLFQQRRYRELMDTCEAELRTLARLGADVTAEQQVMGIELGAHHSEQLTLIGLGDIPQQITKAGYSATFSKLPKDALTQIVGYVADGSPLEQLTQRYGIEAAAGIKDALVTGVALGHNPKKITSACRKAFGRGLVNIMVVCRTETLRAYRSSSLESYRRNDHIVKGWIWHSACQRRTCAACWAKHGSFHELGEDLNDHPCGRCSRIPKTKTWQELYPELDLSDVPETSANIPLGSELFAKLSTEDQKFILGPAKYQAYQEGKLELSDLAGVRHSDDWGSSIYERSLRSILQT